MTIVSADSAYSGERASWPPDQRGFVVPQHRWAAAWLYWPEFARAWPVLKFLAWPDVQSGPFQRWIRQDGGVRELIYVSQAKLRQLVPDLPKRAGLRDVEAEVNTPVGGFKVGKAAREVDPGLAAAVARLEASDRAPEWFVEPGIRPGEWVHFEAPMSYGDVGGAVVFLDSDQVDDSYPSRGGLRLLLHGSSEHLVGPAAPPRVPSQPMSMWPRFVRALTLEYEMNVELARPHHSFLKWVVRILDRLTDSLQPAYTAGWVAGYARVTAVIPIDSGTLLAATPLYVEHVAAPV